MSVAVVYRKSKDNRVPGLKVNSERELFSPRSAEGIWAELLDSTGEVLAAGVARLAEGDQWIFDPAAVDMLEGLVISARMLRIENYPVLEIQEVRSCVHGYRHIHFRCFDVNRTMNGG